MKTLIYLAGLVAVGLAVAWFGFGVHPKTVYYKAIGAFSSASGSAVEHGRRRKKYRRRFVDVIKNNYEDQDMTQPIAH